MVHWNGINADSLLPSTHFLQMTPTLQTAVVIDTKALFPPRMVAHVEDPQYNDMSLGEHVIQLNVDAISDGNGWNYYLSMEVL
jgi:hypothetical protein